MFFLLLFLSAKYSSWEERCHYEVEGVHIQQSPPAVQPVNTIECYTTGEHAVGSLMRSCTGYQPAWSWTNSRAPVNIDLLISAVWRAEQEKEKAPEIQESTARRERAPTVNTRENVHWIAPCSRICCSVSLFAMFLHYILFTIYNALFINILSISVSQVAAVKKRDSAKGGAASPPPKGGAASPTPKGARVSAKLNN